MKNHVSKHGFYFAKLNAVDWEISCVNSWSLYSYYDYEEAYFHMRYYKCVEIGLYLLSRLTDKQSKKLLKRLKKYNLVKDNDPQLL